MWIYTKHYGETKTYIVGISSTPLVEYQLLEDATTHLETHFRPTNPIGKWRSLWNITIDMP